MKLERIPHDPGALVELYEEGLTKLGALCERTWHDRLQVIAEGRAARLWGADESLHEIELHFAPAETAAGRDASREIFPGCPLTFQLTEALRASPLVLERFALPEWAAARPPDVSVMEKLWRAQFPETNRWRLDSPPEASFHFTLLAVARCEIQAIDQHWSLHRIAISLSDGEPDETLARDFALLQSSSAAGHQIKWPPLQLDQWRILLHRALERELQSELKAIRIRQETSLRRELERIDDYFDTYERELAARSKKSAAENSRIKLAERLAAARAEHERRRTDQLARHEICVVPHLDALLLCGEGAWRASVLAGHARENQTSQALFVPRLRRWKI